MTLPRGRSSKPQLAGCQLARPKVLCNVYYSGTGPSFCEALFKWTVQMRPLLIIPVPYMMCVDGMRCFRALEEQSIGLQEVKEVCKFRVVGIALRAYTEAP